MGRGLLQVTEVEKTHSDMTVTKQGNKSNHRSIDVRCSLLSTLSMFAEKEAGENRVTNNTSCVYSSCSSISFS